MAYSTKIGDSQPVAVTVPVAALPLSIVEQADIEDIDSAENNTLVSGKEEGACYLMRQTSGDEVVLIIAGGSETNSPWYIQSPAEAAEELTLTLAADVGNAAGITTQLNLVENAVNAILAVNKITPA